MSEHRTMTLVNFICGGNMVSVGKYWPTVPSVGEQMWLGTQEEGRSWIVISRTFYSREGDDLAVELRLRKGDL